MTAGVEPHPGAAPSPLARSPGPLRYLVAGLGGYAGAHHETLLALETEREARVVATCDPAPERFAEQRARWRFVERGVRVFADYDAMLAACADEADVVVIPTPIHLHAPMHRAAVAAGLAVYLEKPPTLDPEELEEMIAGDAGAPRPSFVGFNHPIETARMDLKARLLDGEFGRLLQVRVLACSPRRAGYFTRNGWAGRLLDARGRPLLDSCLGNALGHHAFNALHWAGRGGIFSWVEPFAVRAQLARAHAIEGADTFLVAADTSAGVRLRLAFTHACSGSSRIEERLLCERADIAYLPDGHLEIRWRDGRREFLALPPHDPLAVNHRAFAAALRTGAPAPVTLGACRPFVHLHAFAHLSATTIRAFAPEHMEWAATRAPDGTLDRCVVVSGLAEALSGFLANEEWLPAALCPVSEPPPQARTPDLARLGSALRRLAGADR